MHLIYKNFVLMVARNFKDAPNIPEVFKTLPIGEYVALMLSFLNVILNRV